MFFIKLVIARNTGWLEFDATISTRANSGKDTQPIPGAKLIAVDYTSHGQIVRAVTEADATLSFISDPSSKSIDKLLLKAAQEAAVRRIFPSEYILHSLHPDAVHLLTEGGNWPADRSITLAALIVVITASQDVLCRIWEAVIVAVLQMDEEMTKNKRIPMSEVRTTMNEIMGLYEDFLGAKFERTHLTSRELLGQRNANLEAGNPFGALCLTILVGAFNGCGTGDLVDGLAFDGDGHLQLQKDTRGDNC
ncbi:NAD(P)-binding protein [Trichoderma barbatum]